jgi:hypothetical protein
VNIVAYNRPSCERAQFRIPFQWQLHLYVSPFAQKIDPAFLFHCLYNEFRLLLPPKVKAWDSSGLKTASNIYPG